MPEFALHCVNRLALISSAALSRLMTQGSDAGMGLDGSAKLEPAYGLASTCPGGGPAARVIGNPVADTMMAGWRAKHGAMPDVPGIDMTAEPSLPPLSVVAL